MEYNKAISKAKKIAKTENCEMFVFYEGDGDYQIGNEFDSRTFFNGSDPVACIQSNGEVNSGNFIF
jgi:hypothetical protein